ncbi:MAG TPA: MFS transporter [Rubrivivax sp.]|jgi:DHA1 family tetracycline resistance protein-like MFS transporter|nr:MFS transporter [Rubrivivax sp.]
MPDPGIAGTGAAEGATGRRAAMPFILFTVLLDMVAIGLMVPVLPHIVGRFTDSPDAQTLAFLAVTLAFGIANFFGSPVLGALSDRFGRRPVLLIGFLGMATSFFVTAAATALWMLVAVRLFSGAMQSNISVANAYVADISTADDRARRFGQLGAMFGIGFILGPAVGGVLGDIDVRLPFVVAGTLALANTAYGWFVLPESLPPERRRPFEWRRANPVSALRGLRSLEGVGPLVVTIALASLAQYTLHMTWVLYTKFKFGWGPGQVGWSLFVVGLVAAVGQGVLMRPLLARWSPQKLAVIGMGSGTLAFIAWGLATEPWMVYVVIVANVLGGTAAAAVQSIVSNAADPTAQGRTMGAVSSLNSLMAVLAPVIGLELLRWVSHLPAGDWRIGLPFFASATMLAVANLIAIRFFLQRRRAAAGQPA